MKPIYPIILLLLSLAVLFACQSSKQKTSIEKGTSKRLADLRKATITNVTYDLSFQVPKERTSAIAGEIAIIFDRSEDAGDLILDFKNPSSKVIKVAIKESEVPETIAYIVENEHIIIDQSHLKKGRNHVAVSFEAGDQALNRNDDFLYALFVPDRASTAFPCFDQPNIKARYNLKLTVPSDWKAFANYSVKNVQESSNLSTYIFNETLPISTYLFSFGVGAFESITKTVDGRTMTLYHRETDVDKIAKNAPVCFDLHGQSLAWLEEYTGIPYPFEQFNFALIPAFQFGGMEHPGAIWYRARSLFLDDNATVNQKMGRNSLIAHETAHMWFGDLVTMDWFDDVWLKEVFANFMAAKMVNPNFPEIDHDLRFLLRHQPSAYGEDRTAGSHAIQQELDNLNEASLLYGRIIYQKAPVVMKQLESIIGNSSFQTGLQDYLKTYSFGNATWDDLIAILDKRTDLDLATWSKAWVKESGMPHYKAELNLNEEKISSYAVNLVNSTPGNNLWQQNNSIAIASKGKVNKFGVSYFEKTNPVPEISGYENPDFILPSVSEMGYGFFELDQPSRAYLLNNVHLIPDDLIKSSAWFSLWEAFLRNQIPANEMMQTIIRALPFETDVQGLSSRLGYLRSIYWGFISDGERLTKYADLPNTIWQLMETTKIAGQKKLYYDTFVSIALSENDINKLLSLWNQTNSIQDLTLSENDYTKLAYELAVREIGMSQDILDEQLKRISNPDRKAEMAFVIPALSMDMNKRDQFFEKLKDPSNRQKESWILTALPYLHHPLRSSVAEKYIRPSLDMVQDIQQTGSIFFPQRWTGAILGGHQSKTAVDILHEFIDQLPATYPVKLKNKILMQGDMLERKASMF